MHACVYVCMCVCLCMRVHARAYMDLYDGSSKEVTQKTCLCRRTKKTPMGRGIRRLREGREEIPESLSSSLDSKSASSLTQGASHGRKITCTLLHSVTLGRLWDNSAGHLAASRSRGQPSDFADLAAEIARANY